MTHEPTWADIQRDISRSALSWSVRVIDLDSPASTLVEWQASDLLRTASIGKLALLAAAADAIQAGELDANEHLTRDSAHAVADSGVWQHLRVDTLAAADVARLIGLSSDNWATNTLLHRLGGVDMVRRVADRLEVRDLYLYDRVRDVRTPEHPETLSRASADGCIRFWRLMLVDTAQMRGNLVMQWLADGLDTSMVASRLGFDPLAHSEPTFGVTLTHKTGTDEGVRADTGVLTLGSHRVAYACIANWDAGQEDADREPREAVHHLMGMIGRAAYAHLRAAARPGGVTPRED